MVRLIFIIALVLGFGPGALPESKALTFTTIQQNGSVDKDITVAPGELYEVSFDLVGHTTDDVRFVVSEGANVLVDESALADGAHQYYFTAVGSTVTLTFQRLDPGTDSRMFVVNSLSFLKQEEKVCQNEVGEKQYEVSDHLGNVRATISDNPDMDEAEVISAVDYYPFGMEQSERNYSSPVFRYGFQGQEKDDEVREGSGMIITYKYRMHDSRIGRFLSLDPLAGKFPWNSPYAFSENRVIDAIEMDGLEQVLIFGGADLEGKGLSTTMIQLSVALQIYAKKNNLDVKVQAYNSKFQANTVNNAAKYIKDNYVEGEKIVLYGYSIGGGIANEVAKKLKEEGIKVDLLVTVDAAASVASAPLKVPDNVEKNENYYQTSRDNLILSRGYEAEKEKGNETTKINNHDVTKEVKKSKSKGSGKHGAIDEDTLKDAFKNIKDELDSPDNANQ